MSTNETGGGVLGSVLQYAQRPWFPALVAGLNFADTFTLVVPNDVLLVAAVSANRKRWISTALIVTLGAWLGAAVLCGLAMYNPDGIRRQFSSMFESWAWKQAETFIDKYGVLTIGVGSAVLPIVHPVVFAGVMAKMSAVRILVSVFLGRLTKYLIVSYLTASAVTNAREWSDSTQSLRSSASATSSSSSSDRAKAKRRSRRKEEKVE